MKFFRVLLLFAAVGVAVLLLAGGFACTSGFQTWAARKALAGIPGYDFALGRVSIGWGRIRLEQVRVVKAGTVLTLPEAEIELPLIAAVFRQEVRIERLSARGWTMDLSQARPPALTAARTAPERRPREFSLLPVAYADEAAARPAALFSGIFNQLRLPVDLALESVELAGDVLLPGVPGHPPARASVTVTGGSLRAGHPGKFDYAAHLLFEGGGGTVRELDLRGTLGVVMDTPRTFTRFVLATEAEASGPKFPGGVRLAIDLLVARSAAGENYAAALRAGPKQLAVIETGYPAGGGRLNGMWRLDMHDTDLVPFALGRELPVFEAAGDGSFDTDAAFAELHATGRLNATADHLSVISPSLALLGQVRLAADFDFSRRGDATRVDRLAVTVAGARPVATVQALQPFEFNLKTGELNVADPAKDLLGVVLQGLPLAWLGPLAGRGGFALSGGDLQGEFAASARNGGFALRPNGPLTAGNLSLTLEGGRQWLNAVEVSLTASADYAPQGWQVQVAPLTVSTGGTCVLNLEAKAGQLSGKDQPVKSTGRWTAQLPALLAQPVATGTPVLTGGVAEGDFIASLGGTREFQAHLALTGLATAATGALPAVKADLRADLNREGRITFNAPLLLMRDGRQSDVTLAGTLMPGAAGLAVEARLTGEFLAVEDAQILTAPFDAAPTAAAEGVPAATARAVPFWSGVTGRIALALKKATYNGRVQVTDVAGVIQLEPAAFRLVNGRGGFDSDSDVRLAGGITFDPSVPQPYALAADFALNNFATGPAFRAINPAKPPTLEARINLTSRLTATAATVSGLATRARGDLLITSKGGVFRGLSADLTDRIQKSQSRLASIAGFLGVAPDDYVNKTKILADIAKALNEIPFDQLSVTATRDASLNLLLKDFTLISPEVRIVGGGEVRYVEGITVLAQPMDVQLNLGARGRLADLIKRARMLDARQDDLGYSAFAVPLRIGGTLASPDTNEIRAALLNSALERSGLLDSILGK